VLTPPVPGAPDEHGGPRARMAAKLQTPAGQAIYRLRKCTVEPAIGIIKETMGFRQFSLRGLVNVTGEWILVCLAYNIKRLHPGSVARSPVLPNRPTLPRVRSSPCPHRLLPWLRRLLSDRLLGR